jgi:hypothetical protein
MFNHVQCHTFASLFVVIGSALALALAVVPFYNAAYQLDTALLLYGLMPYVIYGSFIFVVRGWPLVLTGMLVLAIDVAAKIPARLAYGTHYAQTVTEVSLITAVVVLPVSLAIGFALTARRRRQLN